MSAERKHDQHQTVGRSAGLSREPNARRPGCDAVSMTEGSTAFTVILPFNSAASDSVRLVQARLRRRIAPCPSRPAERIAPILTMRAPRELRRCGIAAREAFSAVSTLRAYMRCQTLESPSAMVSKVKSAGNIDQRVDRAEMSGGSGIDRFFRLCCISRIDAAEFDPLGCCRELRRGMIDTGDSRAPRKGFLGDHLAKRAQRACDDNDFTLHGGLRANENESRPQPLWLGELHLQRCAALAEIDRDDTGNECR